MRDVKDEPTDFHKDALINTLQMNAFQSDAWLARKLDSKLTVMLR